MSSYKEEDAMLRNLTGYLAQIRAECKAEGIKESIEEVRKKAARKLLENGIEISIIAAATSFSQEKIRSLLS